MKQHAWQYDVIRVQVASYLHAGKLWPVETAVFETAACFAAWVNLECYLTFARQNSPQRLAWEVASCEVPLATLGVTCRRNEPQGYGGHIVPPGIK